MPARAERHPVPLNPAHARQRPLSSSEMADFELADEFLPVHDVSDAVATVADADRETTWRALLGVDLLQVGREAPMVGMLGALRMLPEIIGHLLSGEPPAKPPESMPLRDLPRSRCTRAAGSCSTNARPTRSRWGWWASSGGR
ncbi:MAG: hypothetical protein WBP81_28715 [Solirubrobacteraceae bacterium]